MSLGQILNPLYQAVASILTFFYSIIPNYAVAIGLLTIAVMVVLAPLTVKSTRSMLSMQKLAPEMKKLQQKYKGDRQKLNEEMMKLYKEHNVSPVGGCLPMLLQLPFFFIMYNVVRGLTNTVGPHHTPAPKYISHTSQMYHDLIASGGQMKAFGINLAGSATSHHSSFAAALPFYIIIVLAIALQYLQMRQLTARNPQAAAANPQAQKLQKFMPLIFAFIYISIQAAVNIYFIVSSLFRIGQQELMFRYDPVIKDMSAGGEVVAKSKEVKLSDRLWRDRPWRDRQRELPGTSNGAGEAKASGDGKASSEDEGKETGDRETRDEGDAGRSGDVPRAGRGEDGSGQAGRNGSAGKRPSGRKRAQPPRAGEQKRRPHPRAQGKRPRKAR